jgi:STE24 endopeptidase
MQLNNVFVILFFIGTGISLCLNQFLEYTDYKFRKIHGNDIPSELADVVDREKIAKTVLYEDSKYKLWIPSSLLSTVLDIFLLASGFYPWLFFSFWNLTSNIYGTVILFAFIISIPAGLIAIPFSLYQEFVVEKKFGFSTMTVKLWIVDELKSLLLSAVVSVLLLAVMTFLFEHAASFWWLLLGIIYILFSLLVSVIYPVFIAPLFNKFTPLDDGSLKNALEKLLASAGFAVRGVFVMDASKRSKHSNAYFTGIGKSKRIVLYDTLLAQLSTEETVAVLSHELGHYKKHHVVKRLCCMIPVVFFVLAVADILVGTPSLYQGFGFSTPAGLFPHMKFIGLFLLSEVFGGFSFLPALLGNYFSRKDEFEADRVASELCGSGEPLITALIKLHSENLSELTPPPVYCLFRYDHPPLLERIRAIRNVSPETKDL